VCTASWLIRPDGYELFFNRDERNERLRASGPRTLHVQGRAALAPKDADAGGTWIGVNDCGVSIGLLNAWDVEAADVTQVSGGAGTPRSRGLLVQDLLAADTQEAVRAQLVAMDLRRYRGFHLMAFAPGREPVGHRWDGSELQSSIVEPPLCSSSFDAGGVRLERSAQFRDLESRHGALDSELLELFHASHSPERGPFSVCMHRADAATVSATHIHVDKDVAQVRYADGPLCTQPFGEPALLALHTGETANP